MPNKNLLWLIPSYEKKMQISNVDLQALKELAIKHSYTPSFVFLLDNKNTDSIDEKSYEFGDVEYSIALYDKKVYPNTSIMKQLENATFDNVIITSIKYTTELSVLDEMLEKSNLPKVNFVHLQKKRLGFYGELTNLTKALYNKIVKMFTNGQDNMYVRNCVVFDRVVLDLMQDFPNNSGIMRETTFLAGTQTEIIQVDEKFKNSKLKTSTMSQFFGASFICLLALALFVVICVIRTNIDVLLWLIVADIILFVAGIIFVNYSILQEKIKINNFNLDETKNLTPLLAKTYNKQLPLNLILNDVKQVENNTNETITSNIIISKTKSSTKTKQKTTNNNSDNELKNTKVSQKEKTKTTKTKKQNSNAKKVEPTKSTTKKSTTKSKDATKKSSTKKSTTTQKSTSTKSKTTSKKE